MARSLVIVSLLALTLAGVVNVHAPSTFTYSSQAASRFVLSGEPSIAVERTVTPNRVFVTWPDCAATNGAPLFRSDDDGATFTSVGGPAPDCSGDADVAVDAVGRVYMSQLLDSGGSNTVQPLYISENNGTSWVRTLKLTPSDSGIAHDRQWLDARGNGESIVISRAGSVEQAWTTTDAWAHHTGPINAATDVLESGPVTYAPDGTVYFVYLNSNSNLAVAKSTDAGATWTEHVVSTSLLVSNNGFPAIDTDSAGNVYVAVDHAAGSVGSLVNAARIYFSASTDGGVTWTTPKVISEAGATNNIFAWVSAGSAGHVDVVWYRENPLPANTSPGSNLGGPTTTWDVVMAQSANANVASSAWTISVPATDFHTGSICNLGLACPNPTQFGLPPHASLPFDRTVLDFFEIDQDSAGNALITYPQDRAIMGNGDCSGNPDNAPVLCSDDRLGDPLFESHNIMVTKQTGGPTI